MNCERPAQLAPLLFFRRTGCAASGFLPRCAQCAQEMAQYAEIDARLRELLREPQNTFVLDATIAAQLHHRWRFAATTVGVAALLVIGVFAYRAQADKQLVADAARDHHEEVVDREPRTWVVDASAVEALAGRSGLSPELLSRLTPAGYHPDRAKLCRGSWRFLHLVFTNGPSNCRYFSLPLARPSLSGSSAWSVAANVSPCCEGGVLKR